MATRIKQARRAQRTDGLVEAKIRFVQDPSASPGDLLRRAHEVKRDLCSALEQIADALPDGVDRMRCLRLANVLAPALRDIHVCEEMTVFPAYVVASGEERDSQTLRRLRAEHVEDQCFADEVTEVLMAIGHGDHIRNAEATGFMLRGLFETMRRHMAFESEHLLPRIEAWHG